LEGRIPKKRVILQNKFGTKKAPQNKFGTKKAPQNKFCTPNHRKINLERKKHRKINLERKKHRKINLERKKHRKINLERKKHRKVFATIKIDHDPFFGNAPLLEPQASLRAMISRSFEPKFHIQPLWGLSVLIFL